MKKTKLFGLALIATMASFTACTNDSEEVLAQESEIKLTSEITPSRVANTDLQSTQIVSGRQVGVTITGAKTGHNNVAWTVGETGNLTNTGDAVYYGDGAATITAYHPFNDDWDESTTYAFSVSTDQTDEASYLNSDLLWATASSVKKESAISLAFAHKLAKINVTLVPEKEGDDLNVPLSAFVIQRFQQLSIQQQGTLLKQQVMFMKLLLEKLMITFIQHLQLSSLKKLMVNLLRLPMEVRPTFTL